MHDEQEQEKRFRELMFPKNVRHVEVEEVDGKAEDVGSNPKKRKLDEIKATKRTKIVTLKIAPDLIKPQSDPSIDASPLLNQPETTDLRPGISCPLAGATQSQPAVEPTSSIPLAPAPADAPLPNALPPPCINQLHPSIEQTPSIPTTPRLQGRPKLDPTITPAQRLLNLVLRKHNRGKIQITPCLRCFKMRRQCVKDTKGEKKSCTSCRLSRCRCEGAVELGKWVEVNGAPVHRHPRPSVFALPYRFVGFFFVLLCCRSLLIVGLGEEYG